MLLCPLVYLSNPNLNHVKWVTWFKIGFSQLAGPRPVAGSLWQGYVQSSPAFWPPLGSLLDITMPPVFDWLHPRLRFSLFILYWKLIPFFRIIKLLLLLCFTYGCWLLALEMNLEEFRVPIVYPLFSLPDALGSWVGEVSLLRLKYNLLELLPSSWPDTGKH